MSTYNNKPTQNNRDYLKELKIINKEIDKIYKQLSKDETLSDILNNIKTDFINNNISIIEDNISNNTLTNYNDFNSKIIKILNIFIKILEDFVLQSKNKDIIKDIINEVKRKIADYQNINKESQIDPQNLDKIIRDVLDTNKISISSFNSYKYICVFNYYLDIFNNDVYEISRYDSIQKNNNLIKEIKNEEEKKKLNEENKNIHNENKKKYRNLINFIKLESSEIIAEVSKKLNSGDKENKEIIDKFKKNIYYETININNTQVNDEYAKIKENSNERIDLESRKKLLKEMKELLDKQLNKLNDIIQYLIASYKQEFSKEIIEIRKYLKDYTKEREYTDSILSLIVNEETEVAKFLAINLDEKKMLEDLKNSKNREREGRGYPNGFNGYNGYGYNGYNGYPKQDGGEKKSNKYYEDKYNDIKKLNNAIDNLIKSIQTIEGINEIDNPFEKKNNINLEESTEKGLTSIYKNIWYDYIRDSQKNKAKGNTIETLKQENRLYDRFKDNELDPEEVLKISFEDKVIFICIILIIRTFSMVLIEFLIDYNVIGSIFRGIVIYSAIYILLIILSVILINYDSYKLRIIVNYLNLHINSSNIFIHIIMFCLLIGLILIIINNNDINSIDIDTVLSYTYVYKYIYEIAEKSKNIYENPEKLTTTSNLIISEKEKMKLRYRLDIITMLIFIFSALLILVM
jgi:hypothetical protein